MTELPKRPSPPHSDSNATRRELTSSFIHRDCAKQLIDFNTLSFGKVHPTDVDGVIEWHDKAYVWLEYKYNGSEVPHGQRLFLERRVNADERANRQSIAIVADHYQKEPSLDISAGDAIVRNVFWHNKWYSSRGLGRTVKEVTEDFLDCVDYYYEEKEGRKPYDFY